MIISLKVHDEHERTEKEAKACRESNNWSNGLNEFHWKKWMMNTCVSAYIQSALDANLTNKKYN